MQLGKDDMLTVLSLIDFCWKGKGVGAEESAIQLIMFKRRVQESLKRLEAAAPTAAEPVPAATE
jgi:hypothetical protein